MNRTVVPLPSSTPGTRRELVVYRFGKPGARKVYLQAALHADELPGMLVLHHLLRLLAKSEEKSEVTEEIVVVPYANPVGLSQFVGGNHVGRHELDGFVNFNRNYPDIAAAVAARVEGKLTDDPAANVWTIRAAMREILDERQPLSEIDTLRHHLFRLAVDADITLDLHCDFESMLHLYVGTPSVEEAVDLAADLQTPVVLHAEESGGNPFDEAVGSPWWALARRFPGFPIPPANLSVTVELRGECDVDDQTAEEDARRLFRFLQRRGFVAGDPGPLPPLQPPATPLDGVDMIRTPVTGIIVWKRCPGDRVEKGEVVAEVVDVSDPFAPRTPLSSCTAGVVFGNVRHHLVRPGQIVVKVAGATSWRTGALLTD